MNTLPFLDEQNIRIVVGEQNFVDGRQYVDDEAIVGAVRQGMTLKAYCYGSLPEPYRVQVTCDAKGITGPRCTCSGDSVQYGHHGCQHVAALLLMWRESPEAFTEMDDLDVILKRHTKDELIALIKQMLSKQPEVEWQLTMPPPTSKRKASVNPETYRHQVADAFRHSGRDWRAVYTISDELFGIKHTGDEFAKQHDYAAAAMIYEEVVMGVLENLSGYHDEGGSLSHVVSMTIDTLNELLAGGRCDAMTREKMFETLFAIYHFDVETGEIGLGDNASKVLLQHVTAGERHTIADWAYEVLSEAQGTDWRAERHCQKYGSFLLSLMGEELTDELFLHICHKAGRFADAVERLLALDRIEEAAAEAGLASDRDLLGLIDLFSKYEQDAAAEQLMLERSKQTQNMHILDWLKTRYWTRDDYTAALELAETIFRAQPDIKVYRDIRQLAEHLGCWENMRAELLSLLNKSGNVLVLTHIALDEDDIDRALALVKSQAKRSYSTNRNNSQIYTYGFDYEHVVFDVANAAEETRPYAAIELYQQHVERLLDKQDRSTYRTACDYLVKIRTLYEKLNDLEGWTIYFTDFRKRINRLRTFKEQMANGGLQ